MVRNMWLIYIPEYPNHACSVQPFSELHPYPRKGSADQDPPYLTDVQNLISETKPWNVKICKYNANYTTMKIYSGWVGGKINSRLPSHSNCVCCDVPPETE